MADRRSGRSGQKGFHWKTETLFNNVKTINPKLDRAIVALTEFYGQKIEDEARKNAPWTDRSTNARSGLTTAIIHEPKRHRIILFHRVDYGIWLEIAMEKRFEIIMPTLRVQGALLMARANKLMGAIE